MRLLRYLLFPVVPIYWLVTWLRNRLYDLGIFKSKSYNLPIICVGNLSTGGTGKTPMVEYLIKLLKPDFKLATLSRGYKRNTSGFVLADASTTSKDIGDEPFQFHKNHPLIYVAVDENRQRGIETLMAMGDKPEVILLDDAFQHRKVKAGLNILLTCYGHLYSNDTVLPTGNLREPKSGASRADIVVVTKCPEKLNESEQAGIASSLNLLQDQELYFSHIVYSDKVYGESESISIEDLKHKQFTLITGIADASYLVNRLKVKKLNFYHKHFPDHHNYSDNEITEMQKEDFILTTVKDYVRLVGKISEQKLYYIPIEISIDRADHFREKILDYCR